MKEDLFKMVRTLGVLTTIPMLLVAGPLVAFFAGQWIDRRLGTSWATPVLVLIGLVAGARETYRIIRDVNRDT